MRIGILTSIETRHRYFVQAIRSRFRVVAVVYEKTGYSPAAVDPGNLTADEARIVAEHFAERSRQEQAFFGHASEVVEGTPSGEVVKDLTINGIPASISLQRLTT